MARLTRLVLFAITIVSLVALGLGAVGVWLDYTQPGPLDEDKTVIIPRGASVARIAEVLAGSGAIVRPILFRAAVTVTGQARLLRAGEYAIPAQASPAEIAALLVAGRSVVRRLTVVEGHTTSQVLALVTAAEALEGRIDRITGEGAVLPETYFYSLGDSRAAVEARMTEGMNRTLNEVWAARRPGSPFKSPAEALVLASIIERETSVAAERPRLAAVFFNRLRRGMKLQSDPTVAYALTEGGRPLDRPLTRIDLRLASPYNTYVIDGLPPGPICNPGRESIAAALNPAETGELYFVADGTGGHVFATTLDDHNRNVARWRRLGADDGDAPPP